MVKVRKRGGLLMVEAFSLTSIDEALAAYREANGDLNKAAEILADNSDNSFDAYPVSCSSSSSNRSSTENLSLSDGFTDSSSGGDGEGGEFRGVGGKKGRKVVAACGTVSNLIAPLRGVCHHKEAYVRRAALFASSCIVNSLHPSFIAFALLEGNQDISIGLEWIRTWALQIAESDTDRKCCTTAMACLQLHAEMSLGASRAVETAWNRSREKSIGVPGNLLKGQIKIPGLSSLFLS